ncbi:MAG: arsenosugar biosynthesis radical SAM (seleno)protein ArsS [Gammaproteobacteria bacterium]
MHATLPLLENGDFPPIVRNAVEILQVNLGYRCNLSCVHCHVNAGPARKESMDRKTVDQVLDYALASNIRILDLTGGAPEMNPHFRYLVESARSRDIAVIDRCNLVILREPGYEDLGEFLAANRVEITASLPCYLEDNVDKQRGKGVFQASIEALRQLNALGYGRAESGLTFNLVYNPQGASLPPDQEALEKDYKHRLKEDYGVEFDRLFAMANMPIQRFGSTLVSRGQFENYMNLLKDNFNPENLGRVMCRNTLSVDWKGYVYDCDFNQMLGLPLGAFPKGRIHIAELKDRDLSGRPVTVRRHCYGCTAGRGSSCGGVLG